MRHQRRRRIERGRHVVADHALQGRTGALERYVGVVDARLDAQQFAGEVGRSANAARAERQLARIGLGVGDELLDVVRRNGGVRVEHVGLHAQHADRRVVLHAVIRGVRVERHIDRQDAAGRQHDGMTVGRGAGDDAARDGAPRPRPVLDDDGLLEVFLHLLGEDAGHHVARAAGGKAQDHGDRLGRIGGRSALAAPRSRRPMPPMPAVPSWSPPLQCLLLRSRHCVTADRARKGRQSSARRARSAAAQSTRTAGISCRPKTPLQRRYKSTTREAGLRDRSEAGKRLPSQRFPISAMPRLNRDAQIFQPCGARNNTQEIFLRTLRVAQLWRSCCARSLQATDRTCHPGCRMKTSAARSLAFSCATGWSRVVRCGATISSTCATPTSSAG